MTEWVGFTDADLQKLKGDTKSDLGRFESHKLSELISALLNFGHLQRHLTSVQNFSHIIAHIYTSLLIQERVKFKDS